MIIVSTTAIGQLLNHISAEPEDVVQMSPGTYAHTLGTPVDVVKLDYPKSSVIQNATGDISLNVTLNSDASSVWFYIPPEFSFLRADTTSIWTSITNDYKHMLITKLSSTDTYGPLWWNVRIENATIPAGSYFIRMFNIKAPDVCGRYFLKVFVDGKSIGSENFPTLVVKCSLDPSYISGRVLNGDPAEYGMPVNASGKVVAQGITALGKTVKAQAYFNASENGAYTIYGLASGTYTLNASASGFAPTTMNETVNIYPGQSLAGVDIYVYPSATISATISSKCVNGLVPWGYAYNLSIGQIPRPISVEISDSSGAQEALSAGVTDPSLAFYAFSFNGSVGLDGHVPQDMAGYVSGLESGDYYLKAFVNEYVQRDVVSVHVHDYSRAISVPFDLWRSGWFQVTVFFRDSEDGHAAPVPKGGQLTLQAYELDGTLRGSNSTFVPEGAETWTMEITGILSVNSIFVRSSSGRDYGFPSGTYMIEASFQGYVQTLPPQVTIEETCSASSLGLDMITAGALQITLRSVDWETPRQEVPWEYPGVAMRLELINSMGDLYTGTAEQQADTSETVANVTDLPAGTYLVRVYTLGYIPTTDYSVSVSLGSISDITVNLLKTTKIEITLQFRTAGVITPIDTYSYGLTQAPVRIEIYDTFGVLAGANATYIPVGVSNSTVDLAGFQDYAGNPSLKWVNYYDTTDGSSQKDYGLPAGTYLIRVWVPGYLQAGTATVTTSSVNIAGITLSLDRLAHVYGSIRGLNMHGDLIPVSWANVTAYGPIMTTTSSLDGFYEMWLVNGTYALAASSLGYETQGTEIRVSMAWETPIDFDMKPPGGTIAELSAAELTLPVVLTMVYASCRFCTPDRDRVSKRTLSSFSDR
jgi:hypothetical protein